MSTTKTQRIVSLILAILFLVSSVGAVAYYVLANKDQTDQQKALQAAVEQAQTQQSNKKEGKLEGTQLSNYQPVSSVPALATQDTKEGTGAVVKDGDTVTAHYTGAIASTGVIFQSSHDSGSPIPFSLNQVIAGWKQGVPGMKEGGIRRILIPASLAYGDKAQGNIPANSDLVFDVELVKIGQ